MKCYINEWITKRGYKKGWIADRLGVSRESVSKWANNKSTPSLETAFKLAAILNCKVDDLWEYDA